jgi:alkylation response protein AidB-like acyl-CoA dehydrogenase
MFHFAARRACFVTPESPARMEFCFTEDQELFRTAVTDMLGSQNPPAGIREAWDGDTTSVRAVWSELMEMGLPLVALPELDGGIGLGIYALCSLLVATGESAVVGPMVETTLVAPYALARVAEARSVLDAVGGGAGFAAGILGTPIPHAGWADHLLLLGDDASYLAPAQAVIITPLTSVDRTRSTARVEVDVDDSRVLRLPTEAGQRARDAGALGSAAQLLGLAARMLDLAVEYAKVREQFRTPIGAFQAVQHHLADARVALHIAEPLVFRAADSLDQGHPGASLHVSMAKAQASDAAVLVARKALQVHGAIGYSTEHDLHFWMKRTWALARAWGDATHHRERVAAALLDGPDEGPDAASTALREGIDS